MCERGLRLSDLLTIKAAMRFALAHRDGPFFRDWEHAVEVENEVARMIEARDKDDGPNVIMRCL